MDTWTIGLDSWILSDGNYPDFEIGQITDFALEFFPREMARTPSRVTSATPAKPPVHHVEAEVVFAHEEAFVVDFGIKAYCEDALPDGIHVGDFIQSEIYLGIDKFSYFEYLNKLEGMPPLIYRWRILEISERISPLIEVPLEGGSTRSWFVADESRTVVRAVERTGLPLDAAGRAAIPAGAPAIPEYILRCEKLPIGAVVRLPRDR